MFKRQKLGGLNLSIQTIVILIMAIAVLGLGLAFITGVFKFTEDIVIGTIDNNRISNPASADDPITTDRNVELRIGEKSKIEMGFFNTGSESLSLQPTLSTCDQLELDSGVLTVPSGEAQGYRATLAVKEGQTVTAGDTIICAISFGDMASEQFFVNVVS